MMQTGNLDMVVHLTSCKQAFSQQQTSTVWQMTSTNLAMKKQVHKVECGVQLKGVVHQ